MARVKGPHSIKYGNSTISDVEELDIEWNTDSNDYDTVQGNKYIYDTSQNVTVTLTLLANDTAALQVLLPQYYVASGSPLSTGENAGVGGAIDVVPTGCVSLGNLKHLTITSCDETGTNHYLRIPDGTTRIDGAEFDGSGARKIMVQFRGEGTTVGQIYTTALTTVS